MIKTKKHMFLVIGAFAFVMFFGTVPYAFFNYTRTGSANTIRTGRIYFNTTQSGTLNITNLFPMSSTDAASANLGEVSVRIQGDTTYADGEEYKVSIVGVNNEVNGKTLPISYIATYEPTPVQAGDPNVIGTASSSYYTARGGNSPVYLLSSTGVASTGEQILVGFIPNGATGIDGTLKVKAFIDSSRIAITDTYPAGTVRTVVTTGYSSSTCESALSGASNVTPATVCASASSLQTAINNGDLTDAQINALVSAGLVTEYTDGTLSTWVNGRTVFTTAEWNSLQDTQTPISFKIRAESNEGTWVTNPGSATMSLSPTSGTITLASATTTTATITTNGDGILSCVTSADAVATCSINGTTLTITGVAAGEATLTVTEAAGTLYATPATATYTVTVE